MIELSNVSKTYGSGAKAVHALKNVHLAIPKGAIHGVIGLSGAGKSTLIRCVNLLERPTEGSVVVDGRDITRLGAAELNRARHRIGMIFQHFNLLTTRTVFDNVALPLELAGERKAAIKRRVAPLLDMVGLADKAGMYPAQLSGGQKQRVAIARALASDPQVLLCDEATSALDPQTTSAILELLRDINVKLGITILLITHEMEVVKSICHRVSLISNGELVEDADVGDFFTAPRTDLGRDFLNDFLELTPPKELTARLLEAPGEHTHPVVRLTFSGDAVSTPLISRLARECDVDVSILQAKVESIQERTLGLMIAELLGDTDQTRKAMEYLKAHQLQVEVLGHVQRDV
ncbi:MULTISPECIES: methionine ABC transporter ATP-binding protein [Halomonadaceae]|uniref:Methionine ABC transporter ATP-binding protein n=1 Tax=Vreelandella malpeensis TaxID=1172368 RepID=A0ABS8DVJ9_9GAMM|nr:MULTISPECIES: methionine ABC transporter ATP-binding protein [Halomonas]MCB8890358.1 methionine ABC transporter ATP-binding protein [Halomonas malpeensis]MCP1313062.1 methionine ABC transporter ATP-binding protein [Halomonas sp. 707D7]MCP1325673.1 methionine ABC transporter ATP-binding protein [Halomonas sp. 707D4]